MALRDVGPGELRLLAESMVGQEHAGPLGSLLLRAARYLGGDPAGYINVANASVINGVGLPDNTTAESAILCVLNAPAFIRTDGLTPVVNNDFMVSQGTYIILTGKPTMRAFQFISQSGVSVVMAGSYFT